MVNIILINLFDFILTLILNKIKFMKNIILIAALSLVFSCKSEAQQKDSTNETEFKVIKTSEEWKQILTTEEYNILRQAGTERPFSSPLNDEKREGTFVCAACKTPLFKSEHKFDSGTGWPSFDRAIEGNVKYSTDQKIGYTRVEEHCGTCGGHLGHVFDDGPAKTTGKRHCINGVALDFVPKK
jgi:peptide-methionine (R)-S-oxide reductase